MTEDDKDKNALTIIDSEELAPDLTWSSIVNNIVDNLEEEDLPDKVVKATELLLVGHPRHEVAKKLGIDSYTLRRWLVQYPVVAKVVEESRRLLTIWRMSKLEQQYLQALEKSSEILDLDLSNLSDTGKMVDPKLTAIIASQARYIIGLFSGQKIDVKVTHELGDTVLNTTQSALDYLAQKIMEQRDNSDLEPIETVYRVIDEKFEESGPYLDSDGNPPFGELGALATTDNGIQCHICGKYYKSLSKHLLTKHNTQTDDYEALYLLDPGAVRKAEK